MQSTVEDINSVQRRVKVDLTKDLVNAAFDTAYRDLQKRANIRGFRQGKAPLPMIKKMYGESVAADVADKLIRQHLFAAIEKNELRPIASPALENINLPKQDEQFSFSAVIDVLPALEIKNYKGVKVVCHNRDVTEETIQAELDALRKQNAKQKALPPDATAQAGNLIVYAQAATVDGESFAALTNDAMNIELGQNQAMPEIEGALMGMKVGEEKHIEIALSQDFPNPQLAGKTVLASLTVKELNELVLPTADDEFAKDLGFKDLEEAKSKIRSGMQERSEQMRRSELEKNILEKIVEENNFDVPPAMVAAVIDDMIEQMGFKNDADKKKAKADQEFRKSLIEPAKKRAKNTLILWEIARKEEIDVTDEDIEQHFMKMLKVDEDPENERSKELLQKLKSTVGQGYKDNLKLDKTITRLIELSKIEEHKHASGEACDH